MIPASIGTLVLHERDQDAKLSLDELTSHKEHGVDNTGNIRVWPAEQVLLHTLLESLRSPEVSVMPTWMTSNRMKGLRVLELGSGMTGLVGLGLAISTQCWRIVITDGNPHCTSNVQKCIDLNRHALRSAARVLASQFVWKEGDQSESVRQLLDLNDGELFDVVVASDVLFFESHEPLAEALNNLLSPSGVALFCQPSRNCSMERFLDTPMVKERFSITKHSEKFNSFVDDLHAKYSEEPTYSPDIHHPSLLVVSKR